MASRWNRSNWGSPSSNKQNLATSPKRGSGSPGAQDAVHIWQPGEIAFLKSHLVFDKDEQKSLITSRYLEMGATGHPVVVLRMSPNKTHAAITTASSYHADGANGKHIPPWLQSNHTTKQDKDFRAFEGSELPPSDVKRPALQLEDGKFMPKKNACWIYVRNMWVVPVTVLGSFDQTPDILRLTDDARLDLLAHMEKRSAGTFAKVMEGVDLEYIPVNTRNLPVNDPSPDPRPRRQYRAVRGSPAPLGSQRQGWPSATNTAQPASASSSTSLSWRRSPGQPSATDRPQPAPAALEWRRRSQPAASVSAQPAAVTLEWRRPNQPAASMSTQPAPVSNDKPSASPQGTAPRRWADAATAGSGASSRRDGWRRKGPEAEDRWKRRS